MASYFAAILYPMLSLLLQTLKFECTVEREAITNSACFPSFSFLLYIHPLSGWRAVDCSAAGRADAARPKASLRLQLPGESASDQGRPLLDRPSQNSTIRILTNGRLTDLHITPGVGQHSVSGIMLCSMWNSLSDLNKKINLNGC